MTTGQQEALQPGPAHTGARAQRRVRARAACGAAPAALLLAAAACGSGGAPLARATAEIEAVYGFDYTRAVRATGAPGERQFALNGGLRPDARVELPQGTPPSAPPGFGGDGTQYGDFGYRGPGGTVAFYLGPGGAQSLDVLHWVPLAGANSPGNQGCGGSQSALCSVLLGRLLATGVVGAPGISNCSADGQAAVFAQIKASLIDPTCIRDGDVAFALDECYASYCLRYFTDVPAAEKDQCDAGTFGLEDGARGEICNAYDLCSSAPAVGDKCKTLHIAPCGASGAPGSDATCP